MKKESTQENIVCFKTRTLVSKAKDLLISAVDGIYFFASNTAFVEVFTNSQYPDHCNWSCSPHGNVRGTHPPGIQPDNHYR